MATLAVFLVLGGGTAVALNGSNTVQSDDLGPGAQVKAADVADNAVNGADVVDNGLTGADVQGLSGGDVTDNSLRGADVNESTLGKVPSAANADAVGGKSAAALEGARAYAVVRGGFCGGPVSPCFLSNKKGVQYAIRVAPGRYCVGVDGISNADASSLATVALLSPGPDTWARWRGPNGNVNCVGSEFEVWTGIKDTQVDADFTIVIP